MDRGHTPGFQVRRESQSENYSCPAPQQCGGIYDRFHSGAASFGRSEKARANPFSAAAVSKVRCGFAEGFSRLPAAFEFRHSSWFIDEVYSVMQESNVALCEAESEKLETPHVQTADFSYLRLRKEGYSSAVRKALTKRVADLMAHGDVFVYFKHEETPEGTQYAESLLAASRNS